MSSGRSCNPSSMLLSPPPRSTTIRESVKYLGIGCLRMIIWMMWTVKVVVVEVMDHCMVFWDWRILDRIEHCSSWKLEYCQFGVILGDYVSN